MIKPRQSVLIAARRSSLIRKEINVLDNTEQEQMISKLMQVMQKLKRKEMLTQINAGEQSGLSKLPDFIVSKISAAGLDLPLPIIEKIMDNSLVLQDYSLSAV